MTEATEWFQPEEDSPFRGLTGSALERIEKKRRGVVLPYGPEWLQPTGPYDWFWDRDYQLKAYEILNALVRGDILKAMFFWPVRHGKTELITVRFPIYWLEHFPRDQIIVGMHTQDKANDISRQARSIARNQLRIDPEREAVQQWGTVEGGTYKAVGVGAALPGYGANLFAIDDPIASREDAESPASRDRVWNWWGSELYSRRQSKYARFLFTMARWHEDDLAGRILNSSDGKNWTVLKLPGLARENDVLGREYDAPLERSRFDRDALKEMESVMGSYVFAGLVQQDPAPAEGGIFKRVWWKYWQNPGQNLPPVRIRDAEGKYVEIPPVTIPTEREMDETLQSWDMSFKDNTQSDPVSGQIWSRKGSRAYLRDRDFGKKDFPKTISAVLRMSMKWPQAKRKLVEDTANGPAVMSQLRGRVGGMIPIQPDGNKIARAHAVTAPIEAGDVFLPHPQNEPWVTKWVEDFAAFPAGKNDHDVDACTQALRRLFPMGVIKLMDYQPARIHA